MRALKIIAALAAGVLLFVAECVTMGMLCIDKSLTEEAAEKAIVRSGIVQEMVDRALTENTVNGGGEYGQAAAAVMETDAMTSFFTVYMTNAMRSAVYGEEYEEIADDELMAAFSAGAEELSGQGRLNITPLEEDLIKQQMQRQMPDLTAGLNQTAEALGAEHGIFNENPKTYIVFADRGSQALGIAVCLLLCVLLTALFWRSRLGLVWCGVITAFSPSMLLLGYSMAGQLLEDGGTLGEFIMYLARDGIKIVAICGFAAAAVFFVLCVLLRRFRGTGKNLH